MRVRALTAAGGAMGAALAKEHSCDDPILIGATISNWIQRVFNTAKIDLSASTTNMPRFTSYLVMVQAIERAGVIDREKIREALFKGTFRGPNGDITFRDNGAPNTRTLVTQASST